MKILEIIPQLSQGGAERFVVDLCNKLSEEHEVILIVFYSLEKIDFFSSEISDRVKVIYLDKKIGLDVKLFLKLPNIISKVKPDVVHTHLGAIMYIISSFLFKRKIRFIHTIHSDAEKEAGSNLMRLCRIIAFKARCVIPVTISEESQSSFYNLYKVKSILIYNGCPAYHCNTDLTLVEKELNYYKHKNSTIIINVARIHEAKNQITLAKSIISLNQNNYNVDLFIIGRKDGTYITQEINNLNSEYVHMLGQKNNPRDYIRVSDAFCLSSIYEGMPITLIECFSVGAIPICTPVGGINNMILDGYNGILTKGTSQEEIEDGIKRFLLLSKEEKKRMKKNSVLSFSKYDIVNCAKNYSRLMQLLIVKRN